MEGEKRFVVVLSIGVVFLASVNVLFQLRQRDQLRQTTTTRMSRARPENIAPAGYEKMAPVGEVSKYVVEANSEEEILAPTTTFSLKTTEEASLESIQKNLTSTVPVKVTSDGEKKFKLTPVSPLGLDQEVKIQLAADREYGWAWQTQPHLAVTSTIPADKATGVPVNAGIELVFNNSDFGDPKSRVSITPAVDFETQRRGKVFVIVPKNPLQEETVYQVTLAPGLSPTAYNDPMGQGLTWEFQTAKVEKPGAFIDFSNDLIQVTPNDEVILKANTYRWTNDSVLKTEIYAYGSIERFVADVTKYNPERQWYNYNSQKDPVDLRGLTRVGSVELKVAEVERLEYVQLPEKLPAGYYLILGKSPSGDLIRTWVESSNMAGYVVVGRHQTSVWLNNRETNGPVGGAGVSLPGGTALGRTDNQGLAVFNTPQTWYKKGQQFAIATEGQYSVVLPIRSLEGNTDSQTVIGRDYWSYLYHERLKYQPTDTVNFWGNVKHRETGAVPEAVKVSVVSGSYEQNKPEVQSVIVNPRPDGSYFGSVKLKNLPTGWYQLTLVTGQTTVTWGGFVVEEYVKPEMAISTEINRKAIFADDAVDISALAKFYDGTPVRNVPININTDYGDDARLTTDERGQLKYKYESKYDDSKYNYYPRFEAIGFVPGVAQEANTPGYTGVYVYAAKLQLETSAEKVGDRGKFKLEAYHTDLSEINNGIGWDVKGRAASQEKFKLTVKSVWYEKKQVGTYYNFVEKVTRPNYEYIKHEEEVSKTSVMINNEGKVDYEFGMVSGKSYTVSVEAENKALRVPDRTVYVYSDWGYQEAEDAENKLELTLVKSENEFSVGENVELKIVQKGEIYKKNIGDRFMFLAANDGRLDYFLTDDPALSFEFDKKHVPNTYVSAIAYTAQGFREVDTACVNDWQCYDWYGMEYHFDGLLINYKQEDSKLEVEQNYNKDKYLPGERGEVTVTVKKRGQTVSGAEVNLVLVDEAMKDIGGLVEPNILDSLYTTRTNGVYYAFYSHKPTLPDVPQAEKGGGGGEAREVFKDTAVFNRGQTNENGQIRFEFTMPDNITTWLAYAQAVTADLDAGQSENRVVASKGFFVTANFPRQVVLGDLPYVSANSFGQDMKEGAMVGYKMEIEGKKENKTSRVFSEISWPIPNLGVGKYSLRVSGESDGKKDGLILPYEVIDVRQKVTAVKSFKLGVNESLARPVLDKVVDGSVVRLEISDAGQEKYFQTLVGWCGLKSNNLENAVSRVLAKRLLEDRFEFEDCPSDTNLRDWQTDEGGLGVVKWGGSDLNLTVWALGVAGQEFNAESKAAARKYLERQTSRETEVLGRWGLVSVGVPQTAYFKEVARNEAGTLDNRLIAGMALAQAGDTEGANRVLEKLLTSYGYEARPYIRVQRTSDTSKGDEILSDTAKVLALAARVESPYADGMYKYLRDYWVNSQTVTLRLALSEYIENQLQNLPKSETIAVLNGQNVEFGYCGCVIRKIRTADLNNFNIQVKKGAVQADFVYELNPTGIDGVQWDERLKLERTYTKVTGEGGAIKPGDIVRVSLIPIAGDNAPVGIYRIYDPIPSGLTPISNPGLYGYEWAGWLEFNEYSVANFGSYKSPDHNLRGVDYYVRATAPGTYIAEPAVIQSELDKSVMQVSGRQEVKIATP